VIKLNKIGLGRIWPLALASKMSLETLLLLKPGFAAICNPNLQLIGKIAARGVSI